MIRFTLVVREIGRLKPDYSLDFQAQELPREGEYLSIQRPDKQAPYGEDVVVRRVWWRLNHPETGGFSSGEPKVGAVNEIFVECDPVIGPYSSDHWRDMLTGARERGADIEDMEVERMSIREDALTKN